jgi:opacity protein-like surface antigen
MSLKNKMLALALGLSTSFSVVFAQEADSSASVADGRLQLGIGVSYRNFHKADFRDKSSGGAYSGWYKNDISTLKPGAPNLEELLPTTGTYEYNLINATWSGSTGNGGYEFNDEIAPIFSASYAFYAKDNLSLSAVANFQFNMLDSSERGGQASGKDSLMLAARIGDVLTVGEQSSSAATSLEASSKYKFDMDLYTLDLGVRLDYTLNEQLDLFVAVGPSISYADMDSSFRGNLYSNGNAIGGFRQSDDSSDWVFGFYASAGAAFWFTEQIGASLEARYDGAFEDAETKLATQSLDTWGAALKLLYRF